MIDPWAHAWLKSRDDPYLFATGVLGIPAPGEPPANGMHALEPWQAKVFQAVRDGHKRVSIRSGHGCKKSATLSILVLWGLLCHGADCKIPVVAGSQNQLVDTIWPEIAKWAARLPEPLREQIDVQKERVIVKAAPDQAFAVARTASKDNPDAMQGFHSRFLLFVVDEASGVHEKAFEVAQGALSTPGSIAVLAGNPTKTQGFFHATHTKLRERWFTMQVSSEDVPSARGHIDDIIANYGRNSNAYRVRVLGEFPSQDDETVIPLDLVTSARGRDVETSNVWPICGADIARFGDDTTALCMRQGNTILGLKEWHGLDGAQVAGRIQALYRETPNHLKPKEIVIDVIGVGASVYDILRLPGSECREAVRGCNVSEAPSISDQDHRLRDQLWFSGRTWFAERKCHLPKELPVEADSKLIDKLVAELTAPTYDFTHLGKRVVESKSDMKNRGVPSPNIADAFLLSLAGGVYPKDTPHRRRELSNQGSWMSA